MPRRAEIALAAFLVLALAIAIGAGLRHPAQQSVLDQRPSTLLAGPTGSRGVYEVLATLRRRVSRRRTPLFDLMTGDARRPAMLVVIAPEGQLQEAELASVVQFLRAGGTVVAASNGGGITGCLGWRAVSATRRLKAESLAVQSDLGLPAMIEWLRPLSDSAEDESPGRLKRMELSGCEALAPSRVDTLLALKSGRPAALALTFPGGGVARLVADPGYLRNRAWRDTRVPEFMVPLLTPPDPAGEVSFDEYHQGFGHEGSLAFETIDWLAGTPAGWALAQLVLVALVWLAVTAVRFGPPQAVIDVRRRSPIEHLEALAAGLESAAGVETALSLIVSGLRRRVARAGDRPRGDPGQWLAALELALPGARGRDAARRLRRVLTQPGGAERVLAAANAVEDVWQELRPRTTPAAS